MVHLRERVRSSTYLINTKPNQPCPPPAHSHPLHLNNLCQHHLDRLPLLIIPAPISKQRYAASEALLPSRRVDGRDQDRSCARPHLRHALREDDNGDVAGGRQFLQRVYQVLQDGEFAGRGVGCWFSVSGICEKGLRGG